MHERSEFRRHWRPLLAATIGMGSALSLNSYILSVFAPYLIRDFGWSNAQWAMLGMIQMLIMVCMPIAGRLTDLYGVRRVAAVGALSFPAFLAAIASMNGDIRIYAAIYIAQTMICSTTTATVYSRVVASAFKIRRGLALGICGSAPPLVAALFSPSISGFVAEHGWRAGYWATAAFSLAGAIATLTLLPSRREEQAVVAGAGLAARPQSARSDYGRILAMPAFWIIIGGAFLANLPFALATSQLKLVVLAQNQPDATAALMVSIFAASSIAGRLVVGVALDSLPAHFIAALAFAMPVVGLLLLASPLDTMPMVALAIALIGLTFGGEGDVIPFLISRYFGIAIFSTVFGLCSAAIGLAIGLGNLVLAVSLKLTGGFDAFLIFTAATAAAGSALFLLLGRPGLRGPTPGNAPPVTAS